MNPVCPKTKITGQLEKKFRKDLLRDKNFYVIGTGGSLMEGFEHTNLILASKRLLTENEIKEFIVDSCEEYLRLFNSHPKIKETYVNYPQKPSDFNLRIMFNADVMEYVDPPYYDSVDISSDGTVFFNRRHRSCKSQSYEEVKQEILEKRALSKEAVHKVSD